MSDTLNLPKHIAIIPDGNRRWAKANNVTAFEGHQKGAETAIKIIRAIFALGVKTGTFWAFSSENWKRSEDEIKYLTKLGGIFFGRILNEAVKDKIHIRHIGRKDRLPDSILKKIRECEEKTKDFTGNVLNIAIDYGGRDEIIRAMQRIKESNLDASKITEDNFNDYLDTAGEEHPNPDLIIRTSGEKRTSGLMPYQAAYAELLFLDKYFPDLTPEDIQQAITDFSNRDRRFGK